MIKFILLLAFLCFFYASICFRLAITHPFKVLVNGLIDLVNYFRFKKWRECKTGKLICYTALFGGGKTLSCVRHVVNIFMRYQGKYIYDSDRNEWVTQRIHVISNVDLKIPYEHFDSLAQVVRVADKFKEYDEKNHTRTCTIVLGDEFSVQMNSRSFKTNIDPLFLNTLLTCRHHHISLIYNAQRFNHVDALLRQVTSQVIECRKVWRFMVQSTYDAYQLEYASDPTLVKPLLRSGFFIENKDFEAYDTLACVGNLKKAVESGDMESEIEIITKTASNPNPDIVSMPSRTLTRFRKAK